MSWNYDPTQADVDPVMSIRFLIGDRDQTAPLLQDEEITSSLSRNGNLYAAAAECCRAIAAGFARQADKTVGPLHISASQKATAYESLAALYDSRVGQDAMPVQTGQIDQNGCTVQPFFTRHMLDENYGEVARAGQSTWGF